MKKKTMMIAGHIIISAIIIFMGFLLFRMFSPPVPLIKWRSPTNGPVWATPALDRGIVYAGSDDGSLYAIVAATGRVKWKFATGGRIRSTPAVADGIVYCASDDGNLYAINSVSGSALWRTPVEKPVVRNPFDPQLAVSKYGSLDLFHSSPVVDRGMVYIGAGDSCIYALEAGSGILKWKQRTGDIVRGTACVCDGLLYIQSWDGFLYCLSANYGSEFWRISMRGTMDRKNQSTPRVSRGMVFCGSGDPYYYTVDSKTGVVRWTSTAHKVWIESSAEVNDTIAYAASSNLKKIFAFNATTGDVLWESSGGGDAVTSPAVGNGIVYFGSVAFAGNGRSQGGFFHALDAASGEELWGFPIGAADPIGGIASPPVVAGDIAYTGSLDGSIYAVTTDEMERTDLALGKQAAASSDPSAAGVPANAVDGDGTTAWRSAGAKNEWLRVDLGSVTPVAEIAVKWDSAFARSYNVELSRDEIHWTTMYTRSGGRGGTEVIGFPPVDARFIRVGCLEAGNCAGYAITTLEIFGPPSSRRNRRPMQPGSFNLEQNFPDPFRPTSSVSFTLPKSEQISLTILDSLGEKVGVIAEGTHAAGTHSYAFSPDTLKGVYYFLLATPEEVAAKRIVILK